MKKKKSWRGGEWVKEDEGGSEGYRKSVVEDGGRQVGGVVVRREGRWEVWW